MAGSLNKVLIIGHLGADPECRNTQSGDLIVNLRIATSESWRDKNSGERKEKTEWHRVVIFNEGIAKVAQQYLKKGAKVYIEGQLQTRKWTDKEGADRYSTEIVLAKYKGELTMLNDARSSSNREPGDDTDDYGASTQQSQNFYERNGIKSPSADLDDGSDIPF